MDSRFPLIAAALAFGLPAAAQDWPRYGHDGALTGRTAARGAITAPRVAWSYPLAGREILVALEPVAGAHRLALDATSTPRPGPAPASPAGPLRLDLDGSGTLRPAAETFHERWAKILFGVAGYQRVAWNQVWTDQPVCRLQLFAYDRGFDQPRLVWQTDPPEGTIFSPLNVVYDINGDGIPEICVAAHYRVMIFEGTTGRKETELRYHQSRPYGWVGVADVDGDGQAEVVTIGDFQSHIDVLDYDRRRPERERLSVKWRRDIEQNIEERQKWPQVGPHPLADVDGHGRPDRIVLNLFNDTGDGQWHAVVLDATTGKSLLDLPRRFLQGTADVDADGAAELFTIATDGVFVPSSGHIELVGARGSRSTVKWARDNAGWCLADEPRFGPWWSTTATQGMQHVVISGASVPTFFVRARDASGARGIELLALGYGSPTTVETRWTLRGLPESCEMVPTEEAGRGSHAPVLVRVRLAAGQTADLAGDRVRASIVESKPLGVELAPPIVARLRAGEGPSVIAEGAAQQVFAIAPPAAGTTGPRLRWQRPGRGMRDGSRSAGVLAADLDGDGSSEVVLADQARAGNASLVALRGDGTTLWEKAFPQTGGAPPVWNASALTFWWPGYFRRADRLDLLVDTRRGLMHSDVGTLIDGRDATTVWTRERAIVPGRFRWGFGGIPLAAADVDGDRLDELVNLYPVCFWVAKGATGEITASRDLAARKEIPAWAAYAEPIVHDFHGDGKPEVLLDSPYILALLDAAGTPLWHGAGRVDFPVGAGDGNTGENTSCKHALVDIDGDGTCEIASAGYGDGVRVIDPRTGKRLWSLRAPVPTGAKVAAANIDGQGGDEILYPAGNTLVVITGNRTSGRVLWTWTGPAALSIPAIADVDGDGLAEIVVQDALGTVHCLAAARSGGASPHTP